MAAAAVPNSTRDMYLSTRPGWGVNPTGVYDGLVSDLAVNDWLIGSRQKVTAIGTPSGGLTPITVARSNGTVITVNYPSGSAIRFAR